jgi:hypothetical protein
MVVDSSWILTNLLPWRRAAMSGVSLPSLGSAAPREKGSADEDDGGARDNKDGAGPEGEGDVGGGGRG